MEIKKDKHCNALLIGNEKIEEAIHNYYHHPSEDNLLEVFVSIQLRIIKNGHLLLPVDMYQDEDGNQSFGLKSIHLEDGICALAAFTSDENFGKAPPSAGLSDHIDTIFAGVQENDEFDGIILNPWGESFFLPKEWIMATMNALCVDPEPAEVEKNPFLSELDKMEQPYVNAHINNISFPKDIEGLELYVYEHGQYNIEDILSEENNNWTVPRSAKMGDIVLFYHAKTAIARITALITKVNNLPDDTEHDKTLLLDWLERARSLYKQYGGKIIAIARVAGLPEYWSSKDVPNAYHWGGRVYADVSDVFALENPVDISEFNSFIKVSRQSSITPLPSKEFETLRKLIAQKNDRLPTYFKKCKIGNFDLSHVNSKNFMDITREYRRRFLLEIDFRSYYVDYLLKGLVKRKFWQECVCHSEGKPNYFVDNVFFFRGKYYLLEVKLNVQLEKNLCGQLKQYVNADYLYIDKDATEKITDFERKFMYVIDTEALYRYDTETDTLSKLVILDDVDNCEDIFQYLTP